MQLWFSVVEGVVEGEAIVVKAHICCPSSNQPVILQRMMELLGSKNSLLTLLKDFPRDAIVIQAIDYLIHHYTVKSVSGVHWNSDHGHGIHINLST